MASADIAGAIERGITSQSELITSLSVATIGGLLAFLLQIRIHNASNPGNQINTAWFGVYCLALVLAALSIALGYLLSGMLVQMAPLIFNHEYVAELRFSDQNFGEVPVGRLRGLSIAQFIMFLCAVGAGISFVIKNRK